jgi:hypothetical protein
MLSNRGESSFMVSLCERRGLTRKRRNDAADENERNYHQSTPGGDAALSGNHANSRFDYE